MKFSALLPFLSMALAAPTTLRPSASSASVESRGSDDSTLPPPGTTTYASYGSYESVGATTNEDEEGRKLPAYISYGSYENVGTTVTEDEEGTKLPTYTSYGEYEDAGKNEASYASYGSYEGVGEVEDGTFYTAYAEDLGGLEGLKDGTFYTAYAEGMGGSEGLKDGTFYTAY